MEEKTVKVPSTRQIKVAVGVYAGFGGTPKESRRTGTAGGAAYRKVGDGRPFQLAHASV